MAKTSLFVEIKLAYQIIGDVMVTTIVMIVLTNSTVVSIFRSLIITMCKLLSS